VRISLTALPWLLPLLALSQQTSTTTGPCSPVAPNNTGTITIHCGGISPKLGNQLVAILNRIAKNQLDPDAVMAKLDEIGKDVKRLGRGIYSGYDFNGARREQRPGYSGVIVGEETGVFQTMVGLQKEQKWKELLNVAETQIKKTPDWLTPYIFSGMANAQLGQRNAAIERLEFVVDQSAGDSNYGDAARILAALKQ
jgi:hypothetical protein